MSLEPDEETKRLIREAFAGEVCFACGFPAQRFYWGRFCCADCVPIGEVRSMKEQRPVEIREVRDHSPRR